MSPKVSAITAALVLAVSGCSIPYADSLGPENNNCSSDADCPPGSYCAPIGGGDACVASSVDLDGLVFEVRPAAGSGRAALSSSLIHPGSISAGDGSQVINLDLTVPEYVEVSPGRVFLPCAGDTAVPARVLFKPVPGLFGLLEGQTYEAASTQDDAGNSAFTVSVPPGVYDLHFQPEPDLALTPDCLFAPPIYLPAQTISKDTGFSIHASEPLLLQGTLQLSQKEDFTKWYLEVVEPFSGQVISESIQPEQEGLALSVPFQLYFDWSAKGEYTPIVRLRPPPDSAKPYIVWSLDGIALQGIEDGVVPVDLDVSGIATQPRKVGGNVFHDGDTVTATVTLQSTSLSGDDLTLYSAVVDTDGAGHFETLVPPGSYKVIARPHREDLGAGSADWDVTEGADCFCGNSVLVPTATTLAGFVSTPSGEPANVEVRLAPAASGAVTYLGKALSGSVPPRPAGAFTVDGSFQVPVDSGEFNLSLVPEQGSGYPWLVRPRLLVAEVGADTVTAAPVVSLEGLTLQNPVVVRGRVVDSQGAAMAGATVRAWIPAGDGSGKTASAVQIGETVADETGEYSLLLPPSIQ